MSDAAVGTRLSDRRLAAIAAVTVALVVLALLAGAGCRATGVGQCLPGSPLMQSAAIAGSLLSLAAFAAALAKRRGGDGQRGFVSHVWLACFGVVLVAFHSTGALDHPPALLLAALLALGVLGVWARLRASRALTRVFGSRTAGFGGPDPALREALSQVVVRKRAVLTNLDSAANEALFSLTVRHWLTRPLRSFAYQRLVDRENALLAAVRQAPAPVLWWRRLHQWLAVAFVLGLAVHVLLATFFAGYVAEGREVYWWHVTAWDF